MFFKLVSEEFDRIVSFGSICSGISNCADIVFVIGDNSRITDVDHGSWINRGGQLGIDRTVSAALPAYKNIIICSVAVAGRSCSGEGCRFIILLTCNRSENRSVVIDKTNGVLILEAIILSGIGRLVVKRVLDILRVCRVDPFIGTVLPALEEVCIRRLVIIWSGSIIGNAGCGTIGNTVQLNKVHISC